MAQSSKNSNPSIKTLDQELIDKLYNELTVELSRLIEELNSSTKIGAYGATATLSAKISEIAGDIKKLQHLPNMLTNPFIMDDPREILDSITKKYTKKKKKK